MTAPDGGGCHSNGKAGCTGSNVVVMKSANTAARFAEEENAIDKDFLITEDNAAICFEESNKNRLRYCHSTGAWFFWNDAKWELDRKALAFHWARELARKLSADAPDRIRYTTSKVGFAAGVDRYARSRPGIAVTSDDWNRDPYLLGTPGGTVDLRTGHLRQAEPADMISKTTAIAPAADAECPRWLQFLAETTGGDQELIRFLQQFAGYSLSGDVKEHTLLFGYGEGGNGKSVLLNTIAGILADYAVTASTDTFEASKFSKHPEELACLCGARFITASEVESNRAWAEVRIKQITGGDKIRARFMRKDSFEFAATFKIFIVGNHKPVLKNVDEAARRRFCIVPFTQKPKAPDRDLEAKLKVEWPAILRWMIEGCLDWQANGLIRPASVCEATDAYFEAQDVFGQFLDEVCDADPTNDHLFGYSRELYPAWCEYASAAGEEAGSQKAFAEALQHRGFTPHRLGTGRGFKGIRLRPDYQRDDG